MTVPPIIVIYPGQLRSDVHFILPKIKFYEPLHHLFPNPGVQASGCHPSPTLPLFTFHGFSFPFPFSFSSPLSSLVSLSLPPPTSSLVPTVSPSPTPNSKFRLFGLSNTDGFAAHLSSAALANTFNCACRVRSVCCSSREGGDGRVYRSHWCHCAG